MRVLEEKTGVERCAQLKTRYGKADQLQKAKMNNQKKVASTLTRAPLTSLHGEAVSFATIIVI